MESVEYRECIITRLTKRGKGTEDSPVRIITEVWGRTANGACDFVAEYDPCALVYLHNTGLFEEVK